MGRLPASTARGVFPGHADRAEPCATSKNAAGFSPALATAKRVNNADKLMSAMVAKRLVEHLERAGFVRHEAPRDRRRGCDWARIRGLIERRSGTLCLRRALKLPLGRIKSPAMIRIAITEVAYNAIASTLPKGAARWPIQRNRDKCFIQVEAAIVDGMRTMRRIGESYSDVILRLVEIEGRPSPKDRA